MEYIEISARTRDDAITKACIQLGISSDNLDYKVISEGSNGFLGIGSKPAIIKARKMIIAEERSESSDKKEQPVSKVQVKEKPAQDPAIKQSVKEELPVPERKTQERVVTLKTDEEIERMKAIAKEFLEGVFKAMGMEVVIDMTYDQKEGSLDADFSGPEMGLLIGKRGQTLDSLQYLTSLVVNKGQDEYVRVKLDTENYRRRRKDTLENLAKNIAYKVKKTRRSVSLEPMNPYERRIIHSALQNNKFVQTTSEGEEPYRHVVVMLRK